MKKEFWRDWKRKTQQEIEAINSLKKLKKIILREIPKEKIVAIYVKGSFIRREMNEDSDVDVFIIIDDTDPFAKCQTHKCNSFFNTQACTSKLYY